MLRVKPPWAASVRQLDERDRSTVIAICDRDPVTNVFVSARLRGSGLIVVNPRYIRDETPTADLADTRERSYPDPLFVFGKAMNALLLDRIENDIRRLQKLNAVIIAGEKRYGPDFGAQLNDEKLSREILKSAADRLKEQLA